MTTLLRIANVLKKTGDAGRSAVYAKMAEGLFVSQVKISERCAAWPEHEVDAIVAARIRGESPEAIKRLVEQLHAARKSFGLPTADGAPKAAEKTARTGLGLAARTDASTAAAA